jgi:hypothetical protein
LPKRLQQSNAPRCFFCDDIRIKGIVGRPLFSPVSSVGRAAQSTETEIKIEPKTLTLTFKQIDGSLHSRSVEADSLVQTVRVCTLSSWFYRLRAVHD